MVSSLPQEVCKQRVDGHGQGCGRQEQPWGLHVSIHPAVRKKPENSRDAMPAVGTFPPDRGWEGGRTRGPESHAAHWRSWAGPGVPLPSPSPSQRSSCPLSLRLQSQTGPFVVYILAPASR